MGQRSSSVLLLFASLASAQSFEQLLPAGAKIIETADVSAVAKKSRMLVLWMVNPSKHIRGADGYCGDVIYGDYWEGPTRLSLVDPEGQRLINTVIIKIDEEWTGREDSFMLPFLVSNDYYAVRKQDAKKEGLPQILDLRDYTGEGARLEFALFAYMACGVAETGLLGYSSTSDRVLQYPVVRGERQARGRLWVEQLFAVKPVRPGYWKFTWSPGHGVDDVIDEEVSFDRIKQRFIEKQTVRKPK
jgi:hypothetical protein